MDEVGGWSSNSNIKKQVKSHISIILYIQFQTEPNQSEMSDLKKNGRSTRTNTPKSSIVATTEGDGDDCLVVWHQDGQNKKARAGSKSSQSKAAPEDEDPSIEETTTAAKRGSFKKQLCARKRNSSVDEVPSHTKDTEEEASIDQVEPSIKRKRASVPDTETVGEDSKQGPQPWTRAEDEILLQATAKYAGQGAR
jgi:hypothetical protein